MPPTHILTRTRQLRSGPLCAVTRSAFWPWVACMDLVLACLYTHLAAYTLRTHYIHTTCTQTYTVHTCSIPAQAPVLGLLPPTHTHRGSNTATYAHPLRLPTPAQLGVVARFSLQEEALVLGNFPRLTCSRIAHHRDPLPPSPQRDSLLLQRPKSKSPAASLDSYAQPQSRPAIACPVSPEFASGGSAPAPRGTEHSPGGALQVGCIGHRISL